MADEVTGVFGRSAGHLNISRWVTVLLPKPLLAPTRIYIHGMNASSFIAQVVLTLKSIIAAPNDLVTLSFPVVLLHGSCPLRTHGPEQGLAN